MDGQGRNTGPQGTHKPWQQQLNEAGARLEEELRRVVRYVDEEVVPEVRKNGSKALRIASERLRKLADHMDEHRSNTQEPPKSEGTA